MPILRAAFLMLLAGGGLSVGAAISLIAGSSSFPSMASTGLCFFVIGFGLLFMEVAFPLLRKDWASVSLSRRYFLAAFCFLLFLGIFGRATYPDSFAYPSAVAWFGSGWIFLGLVPASLGLLVVALSERLGRPLPEEGAARFGFWVWILFAGWAGGVRLASGPVPAWVGTVSIAGTLFLILAAAAWCLVLSRDGGRLGAQAGGPFLVLAAWVFPLWVGLVWLTAFRSLGSVLHGTLVDAALDDLAFLGLGVASLLGFVSRPGRHRAAFGLFAGGLLCLVGGEAMGGVMEALAVVDPGIAFPALASLVKPFLWMRLIGWALIEIGFVAFFFGLRGKGGA